MAKFFTDVRSERLLIRALLNNKRFFFDKIAEVDIALFSNNLYAQIANTILKHYSQTLECIDRNAFIYATKRENPDKYQELVAVYEKFVGKKIKYGTAYQVLEHVKHNYRGRMLLDLMLKGADLLKRGEVDKTCLNFQNTLDNLYTTDTYQYEFNAIKDFKVEYTAQKQHASTTELGILTGIEAIDKHIDGLRPGELGLVTMTTGAGKSITLLNFGFNAYIAGHNVLFITIEMPGAQVLRRFYSRLTGIPYSKFRQYSLTDEELKTWYRKIKSLTEFDNSFFVIDVPENCSVDIVKSMIVKQQRKEGVDLILVDYLNIMSIAGNPVSLDWTSQAEMARKLKAVARACHVPIWTAVQLKAEKERHTSANIADIALAKNIIDHLDVGIYLMLPDEDGNILEGGFLKGRDFRKKKFRLKADFDHMRLIGGPIDGTFNSKALRKGRNKSANTS